MTIEISPLTKEDIPAVVEIVQKAFEADPYFLWVFDAQKFSKERNAASLTARCLWGINNGLFYVAKEVPSSNGDQAGSVGRSKKDAARIIGVAMWLPPHPPSERESWYSYFQSWILTFRQIANNIRFRGHGGLNVKRYWIWKDAQTAIQSAIWDDPRGYYFCNVIAVADDARGNGIGRKLVEIVTDKADREGMKCYLESSRDVPNLEIYGRMGFKFAKEMECHDGEEVCKARSSHIPPQHHDPLLYCMTREPKTAN
ncbi:acetyltransferase [Blastomyces dermatitidis ATCC 18188]|uniref:Acetyltransferase n=1 Tax=Ajellomyces dermatitidis (strain ATCC 18188 / CBS 674.68) TaxID=653446 RepID=F2T671_AJEDA|nr:acetyltransferase [Blastomyces dermatitidis ATCC 18188]